MPAKKKTDTTDNTISKAFKYRLYPTDKQKRQMAITFGCCRYVYNHFLHKREAAWRKTQPTLKEPVIVPGTENDKRPEYVKDENGKVVREEVVNEGYDPKAKNMTFFDTSRLLTTLKKETMDDDGHKWLYDADAVALVYELRNLDSAYQNFFRGCKTNEDIGKPKFKKKDDRDSYKTRGMIVLDVENNQIKLPKLGWVKCKFHRKPQV